MLRVRSLLVSQRHSQVLSTCNRRAAAKNCPKGRAASRAVTTSQGGSTRSSDLYRCSLQCLPGLVDSVATVLSRAQLHKSPRLHGMLDRTRFTLESILRDVTVKVASQLDAGSIWTSQSQFPRRLVHQRRTKLSNAVRNRGEIRDEGGTGPRCPKFPTSRRDGLRHGRHEQWKERMSQPVNFRSACLLKSQAQEGVTGQRGLCQRSVDVNARVLKSFLAGEPSALDAKIQRGTFVTNQGRFSQGATNEAQTAPVGCGTLPRETSAVGEAGVPNNVLATRDRRHSSQRRFYAPARRQFEEVKCNEWADATKEAMDKESANRTFTFLGSREARVCHAPLVPAVKIDPTHRPSLPSRHADIFRRMEGLHFQEFDRTCSLLGTAFRALSISQCVHANTSISKSNSHHSSKP